MEERESLLPLSDSQMEELEEAVSLYQSQLTVDAARFLHNRGIDRELASTFRLGVVGDPMPGHARFQNWLAIPYLDREGRPLTVRFRCLLEHSHREYYHGKYMSLEDDPPRTFNVKAVFNAEDTLHITEGEFDAMILEKIGLSAVAVPGASLWKSRHRRMMAGFQRIFVWGDPDEAGAEFSRKITKQLVRAKTVRLRDGDVTDTYRAGGAEALLDLLPEEGV